MALRTGLLGAFLCGWLAAAQSFGGFQAASVLPPQPIHLQAGKDVDVSVTVRIRPGYHINSNQPAEDYLIPTKLTWGAIAPLEIKNTVYPDGETVRYSFSPKPLSVYSGNVKIQSTFAVPEKVPSGLTQLTGTLRYQACNDKACFPPQKIEVSVPVIHGN